MYRGTGDLAYLNGQVRIAFIRGNEMLEKTDGIPLDGKVLTGICVISGGDTVREVARKSVSHIKSEQFFVYKFDHLFIYNIILHRFTLELNISVIISTHTQSSGQIRASVLWSMV